MRLEFTLSANGWGNGVIYQLYCNYWVDTSKATFDVNLTLPNRVWEIALKGLVNQFKNAPSLDQLNNYEDVRSVVDLKETVD